MNISPSNIFPTVLSLERFYQNCQADLAAASINGLNQFFLTLQGSSVTFRIRGQLGRNTLENGIAGNTMMRH